MNAQRALTLASVLLLGLAATGAPGGFARAAAHQSAASPPAAVYVAQSGHTLSGVFLDFWRAGGGAGSYGYPISEELEEDGRTVQYFGYARFEYVPEDPDGDAVRLGAIGKDLKPGIIKDLEAEAEEAGKEPERALKAFEPRDRDDVGPDTDERRYVAATKHTVQQGFKEFWEATGEAAYLGNPLSEEYKLDGTVYQLFERGQLRWPKDKKVRMAPVGEQLAERKDLDTDPVTQGDLPTYDEALFVAPQSTVAPVGSQKPAEAEPDPNAERWIEVDLSRQYLVAWQGDVAVLESYVSTGRPGFDTPPGSYQVLSKLESEDMEGILGGEYYNVPDVPWTMYFTDGGHALHGTYWHANFGAVMSHGCVNLPMDVAAFLFDWAPLGTRVEVHA